MMIIETFCQKIKLAIDKGAQLIDVRSPNEFAQFSLKGAVNFPVDTISNCVPQIDASRPAFIYCGTGKRSQLATAQLHQLGLTSAIDMGSLTQYQCLAETGE